eukprot:403361671
MQTQNSMYQQFANQQNIQSSLNNSFSQNTSKNIHPQHNQNKQSTLQPSETLADSFKYYLNQSNNPNNICIYGILSDSNILGYSQYMTPLPRLQQNYQQSPFHNLQSNQCASQVQATVEIGVDFQKEAFQNINNMHLFQRIDHNNLHVSATNPNAQNNNILSLNPADNNKHIRIIMPEQIPLFSEKSQLNPVAVQDHQTWKDHFSIDDHPSNHHQTNHHFNISRKNQQFLNCEDNVEDNKTRINNLNSCSTYMKNKVHNRHNRERAPAEFAPRNDYQCFDNDQILLNDDLRADCSKNEENDQKQNIVTNLDYGYSEFQMPNINTEQAERQNERNHYLTTHMNLKRFDCQICGRKFSERSNLTVHMRIHYNMKPFQCLHCKKSFCSKGNFNDHMRRHYGIRLFQCQFCTQKYFRKHQLDEHLNAKHNLASEEIAFYKSEASPNQIQNEEGYSQNHYTLAFSKSRDIKPNLNINNFTLKSLNEIEVEKGSQIKSKNLSALIIKKKREAKVCNVKQIKNSLNQDSIAILRSPEVEQKGQWTTAKINFISQENQFQTQSIGNSSVRGANARVKEQLQSCNSQNQVDNLSSISQQQVWSQREQSQNFTEQISFDFTQYNKYHYQNQKDSLIKNQESLDLKNPYKRNCLAENQNPEAFHLRNFQASLIDKNWNSIKR